VGDLATLLSGLSSEAKRRGNQFEHLVRWYLLNDPTYQVQLRRVWLWDEWPGRWGADAGIDLVAESHAGDFWAIQAKAYDPRYSITKADVDTFISESSGTSFSYRLLVATTDRLGTNARSTIDRQSIPLGIRLRTDLLHAEVDWPEEISDLRPRRPKPKTLFPHNREALDDICAGFERNDRGRAIMACGTGKTVSVHRRGV